MFMDNDLEAAFVTNLYTPLWPEHFLTNTCYIYQESKLGSSTCQGIRLHDLQNVEDRNTANIQKYLFSFVRYGEHNVHLIRHSSCHHYFIPNRNSSENKTWNSRVNIYPIHILTLL